MSWWIKAANTASWGYAGSPPSVLSPSETEVLAAFGATECLAIADVVRRADVSAASAGRVVQDLVGYGLLRCDGAGWDTRRWALSLCVARLPKP